MQAERYLVRDRAYGVWHRTPSIGRFLPPQDARALTMVDVDSVLFAEYEYASKLPLCLVEVARDVGQDKDAGVLRRLAELANLPAYAALYTTSRTLNPCSEDWPDIERFRIKRLWPMPETDWREVTPVQWAQALMQIRRWQMRRFRVLAPANDENF